MYVCMYICMYVCVCVCVSIISKFSAIVMFLKWLTIFLSYGTKLGENKQKKKHKQLDLVRLG